MADPAPFFVTSLAGQNTIPIIPDEFFSGKNEFMKLKLTSAAFDRTWEVKLNGRRFAGGWEDFSAAHCLRNDDVLVFRHDGDMVFHVSPSGRSFFRKKQQCVSSCEDDEDDDDDDDDDEDDADDDDDDHKEEDDTWDDDSESLSSSENSCFIAVTPFSLSVNRVCLSKPFSRSNGLNKRCCEIDLMNQSGKSWVLGLRHNKITSKDYINGGWRSFCRANNLKSGFSYRFNLLRTGTRPLLQLCSDITPVRNYSKPNVKANVSAKYSSEGMEKNFLTVTLKPYMLKPRQLRLPRPFARENEIKEGEISLVDKNGVKWLSYLTTAREQSEFYMTKNWISFCEANRLKIGQTFTLEFVRGDGTTPMLKFCSKVKDKMEQVPLDGSREMVEASRDEAETETRVQKSARVSAEGGPSRCTRASNKSSVDLKNLLCKQTLQPCSICNQLSKVKHTIVDTLTGVRRFRSELEIKEQKLETPLQEIDAFGDKVLEINKLLK